MEKKVSKSRISLLANMVDLFRQQLDELMGKERNVPLNDRYRKKEHFDDPDVIGL